MTFALRLAVLLVLMGAPARAYEIEIGTTVLCDTPQQAERIAGLLEGDTQVAIGTVNAEARDPTACAILNVAYVRGAKAGTAKSKAGTFDIVEVLVVGYVSQAGRMHLAKRATYFTLFTVDEEDA
jgi:hypothetical protein